MGVEGLLRVLKEILDERQVGYITNLYARARGKRLAIDGHGFLHRLVVIPRFDGVAKEPRAVVSSLKLPPTLVRPDAPTLPEPLVIVCCGGSSEGCVRANK